MVSTLPPPTPSSKKDFLQVAARYSKIEDKQTIGVLLKSIEALGDAVAQYTHNHQATPPEDSPTGLPIENAKARQTYNDLIEKIRLKQLYESYLRESTALAISILMRSGRILTESAKEEITLLNETIQLMTNIIQNKEVNADETTALSNKMEIFLQKHMQGDDVRSLEKKRQWGAYIVAFGSVLFLTGIVVLALAAVASLSFAITPLLFTMIDSGATMNLAGVGLIGLGAIPSYYYSSEADAATAPARNLHGFHKKVADTHVKKSKAVDNIKSERKSEKGGHPRIEDDHDSNSSPSRKK